jgi:hypothetical protein
LHETVDQQSTSASASAREAGQLDKATRAVTA